MNFKTTLAGIVKEYRHQMKVLNDAIEAIEVDRRFTDEGKREKINEILELKKDIDNKANQCLMEQIDQFIEEHKMQELNKDTDYELKVANALKMIELLGNNLTDEITGQLLDFNMDGKQLGIFRNILENRCPAGGFNQTFKKLDDAEELLSVFSRLLESAAGLFNHKHPYSPSEIRISDIEYYANVINPLIDKEG